MPVDSAPCHSLAQGTVVLPGEGSARHVLEQGQAGRQMSPGKWQRGPRHGGLEEEQSSSAGRAVSVPAGHREQGSV